MVTIVRLLGKKKGFFTILKLTGIKNLQTDCRTKDNRTLRSLGKSFFRQ